MCDVVWCVTWCDVQLAELTDELRTLRDGAAETEEKLNTATDELNVKCQQLSVTVIVIMFLIVTLLPTPLPQPLLLSVFVCLLGSSPEISQRKTVGHSGLLIHDFVHSRCPPCHPANTVEVLKRYYNLSKGGNYGNSLNLGISHTRIHISG